MKTATYSLVALAFGAALGVSLAGDGQPALVSKANAAPPYGGCQFPMTPAATPDQTAWQLFVAANCTAPNGKLVWENWSEQLAFYPANGKPGGVTAMGLGVGNRLHASPLAIILNKARPGVAQLTPTSQCNPMSAPPPNVVPNATICEEVHINPSAAAFMRQAANLYQVRSGQTAAAQKGTNIQFPYSAIEVKVDWVPASDFATPFSCDPKSKNYLTGVHVEMIAGTCYAMAGMHIESKLLPNWLWATFEPQSMTTNPLRCITFGPCNDTFGSVPAQSSGGSGGFTQRTPQVQAMMKSANLASVFNNYRMDGSQINFMNGNTPTYLGNSVIEGENVGMTFNTASCITCHSVSTIKTDGTDGLTILGSATTVGPQYVIPAGWIGRDFLWSMALACPNSPGIRTCSSSSKSKPKKM